MSTERAKMAHKARTSQRRRTSREKPAVVGEHTRARLQKTRDEQEKLFNETPVRDADWQKLPLTDDIVTDAELPAAKLRAIDAMGEWGVMVEASRASGIGRYNLYQLMKVDDVFRRRMLHARKNCIERIEREMIRRGQTKGGELAGIYVTKHNIPRYREIQRVELSGKGGGPVLHADVKSELLKRLESLALKQRTADTPERQVVGGPRLTQVGRV